MKREILISIVIIFIFASCQEDLKENIIRKIEKDCNQDSLSTISIKSIARFKWDKMYIFNASVPLEQMNTVLGFNYPYFHDIADIIIFTLHNKIVYHIDDYPNPDESSNRTFFFMPKDSQLQYQVFNPNNANFISHRIKIDQDVFYRLEPIN
jgi:hypothetical protein